MKRIAMMLVALVAAAGSHAVHAVVTLYSNDFQSGIGPGWQITSDGSNPLLPARALAIDAAPADPQRRFLGQFGGDDVVSLIFTHVPYSGVVTLSFDAYFIRSWDGNDTTVVFDPLLDANVPIGADYFGVRYTDDVSTGLLMRDTFSIGHTGFGQTYCPGAVSVPCAPTYGAAEKNTLGYIYDRPPYDSAPLGPLPQDLVYHITLSFPTHAGDLVLSFFSENLQLRGQPGELLLDESWGLDNVIVTLGPEFERVPSTPSAASTDDTPLAEPAPAALMAFAVGALLWSRRRRS